METLKNVGAKVLNRKFIGIDISKEYVKLSEKRLRNLLQENLHGIFFVQSLGLLLRKNLKKVNHL